jgi:hypothetical protein
MQAAPIYQDLISQILQLQAQVNDVITHNVQSASLLGTQLIPSGHITALTAAMTTLQADVVTFQNTIPAVVAGN